MARLESIGNIIETDVLVIGGGAAGLWTAKGARRFVENVLVVDKSPSDLGGQALLAGGDIIAVPPEENIDDFLNELVYFYDGLCNQDIVEELLRQSYYRLQDYERLGHSFVREPDGKLKGIPRQGLDHLKCYIYRPYGTGGSHMIRVLVEEADKLGIKRLGRIMITDLLKHEGVVNGAVGFNILDGDLYIFKAGATVLTTGSDSMEMALRAGVELKNFEFAVVRPSPKMFMWEGQTSLFPLGARIVNAKGEPFMNRYSPKLGTNTDWHYNSLGMAIEMRAGRGPVYLDCSQMKPEDIELMKPETGWQLLNYNRLIKLGLVKDFFNENTEWVPRYQLTFGGAVTDKEGHTIVPGLFAAGTSCAVEPGVYMGGWNLCKTAVTGHIAGESAGKFTKSSKQFPIDTGNITSLHNDLFTPLGKAGIDPKEALKAIQSTVSPYEVCLLKNEINLQKALDKIEIIKSEMLPNVTAGDAHYLMRLIEVRNIALTTELLLRASLMRKESRAGHYREDYPDRDDNNWLKWIIISQMNNELILRTEQVPFNKYKFKPVRHYMDNFQFSK